MRTLLLGSSSRTITELLPSRLKVERLSSFEKAPPGNWELALLVPSVDEVQELKRWCSRNRRTGPLLALLPDHVGESTTDALLEAGLDIFLFRDHCTKTLLDRTIDLLVEGRTMRAALDDARSDVEKLVKAHPDGMLLIDQHGQVIATNERGKAHLDKERGSRKSNAVRTHFDESSQERTLLAGDSKIVVEAKTADVMLSSGRCTLLTLRDVTKHKRLEQQLREERDKAGLYFNLADVIFIRLDSRGYIQALNPKGQELIGISASEAVGTNWFKRVLPDDEYEETLNYFHEVMAGTQDMPLVHVNDIVTESGERRTIEWHNVVLRDDDGVPTGTLSSGRDITDERAYQQRLQQELSVREAMLEIHLAIGQAFGLTNLVERTTRSLAASLPVDRAWLTVAQGSQWIGSCTPHCEQETGKAVSDDHLPPCIQRLRKSGKDELTGRSECGCDECNVGPGDPLASHNGCTMPYVTTVRYRESVEGYLGLNVEPNKLGDMLFPLIRQLSRDLGVTIWGHRERQQREAVQNRLRREILVHEAVIQAQQAALEEDDLLVVVDNLLTWIMEKLPADRAAWLKLDMSTKKISIERSVGWGEVPDSQRVRNIDHGGVTERVLRNQAPLTVVNAREEQFDFLLSDGIETAVYVPLGSFPRGRHGILTVQFRSQTQVSNEMFFFLRSTSQMFSAYLKRHEVLVTLTRERKETAALFKAAQSLLHHDRLSAVHRLLDRCGEAFDTEMVTIAPIQGRTIEWDIAMEIYKERQGVCHESELEELQHELILTPSFAHITTPPSSKIGWIQEPPRYIVAAALLDGSKPFAALVVRVRHELDDRLTNLTRSFADLLTAAYHQQRTFSNLADREAHLRAVFDHAQDAIITASGDGIVEQWNRQAERLFGWKANEVVGQPITNLMSEQLAQQHHEKFLSSISETQDTKLQQVRALTMTRRDGTTFPAGVTFSVWSSDGKRHIAAFVRDETERKRLEEQLLQSQRMESLGELAGGVAHDFNNSLTVVSSTLGFIREDAAALPAVQQEVNDAMNAIRAAKALVDKLLTFGRIEQYHPVRINLGNWLQQEISMIRRLIREDVEFEAEISSELGYVNVDETQLEQVLFNLVNNAMDAMVGRQNRKLTLRAFPSQQMKEPKSAHISGEYELEEIAAISITDTGRGIHKDHLARIFEPFFTTKPRGRGTGLGLATAHGIITQHGGTITASSVVDQGTTFEIRLPKVGDLEPESTRPASSSEDAQQQAAMDATGHLILVAEDETSLRKQLKRLLESRGYEVQVARDGLEALRLVMRSSREFSLVLTDVVMPGASGKDVAETTKRKWPNTKVLYMSGHTSSILSEKDIPTNERMFIAKPFDNQDLLQRIAELLR